MVLTIHLTTVGRAVNDEDSYREYMDNLIFELSFRATTVLLQANIPFFPPCPESNTSWAYYVILEAGLTIIAVNLPSLWYYVNGVTPDRVLRSVRSVLSLGSGRGSQTSFKSGNSTTKQTTGQGVKRGQSLDTNSAHSDLVDRGDQPFPYHSKATPVETYAMTDMPGHRLPHPEPIAHAGQGIQVNHSIQRTEEQV
jgi:hypothetical protein